MYLAYFTLIFAVLFLLFFPLFILCDWLKYHKTGLILTRYWLKLSFFFSGIRLIIENKNLIDKNSTYILCPNHFSFIDVLSLPVVPLPFKFVGKESLSTVPIFGSYYKRYHIMVDRDKLKSNYRAYIESVKTLKDNCSVTVFPEGGINVTHTISMSDFKQGPFKMAIETGIPLVPITIADNWSILPDDGKFNIRWKPKSRIIIHPPIDPSKFKMETIKEFQDEVFGIIQSELRLRNEVE